jgi:hypothetical protein
MSAAEHLTLVSQFLPHGANAKLVEAVLHPRNLRILTKVNNAICAFVNDEEARELCMRSSNPYER